MVYYHILHTGEIDFLNEEVNGKTLLDWMIYQAYVCDDLSKPVELYDYGVGGKELCKHHREHGYGGGEQQLLGTRTLFFGKQLHGEQRQKDDEAKEHGGKILGQVRGHLIKGREAEDGSRNEQEHPKKNITERADEVRLHLAFVYGKH